MKRTLVAGLVLLATACGGSEDRRLQYGAPEAPTAAEEAAATDAQAKLAGSRTFAPATEPSYGAPGLAEQLVARLGGYATVSAPAAQAKAAAGRAVVQAFDTGGLDPACVTITETSATWSGCVVETTETDPYSGDTTYLRVTVDGTLSWSAGVTSWDIDETLAMTVTSGADTITMNAVAGLGGSITVTPATIVGHSGSSVSATANYRGLTVSEAFDTTLDLDLAYGADPFCITDGTLTLQQIWTRRPIGSTPADLPDRGWRFEWTGCGTFTVAHGT
jgi:hypothetical protein